MKASDLREQVPAIGLKEYWYPALKLEDVGGRPVGLKMLGEDLVFFRDKAGEVVALDNACPHRGGSLAHGDCHYPGTVACPYHGWVFDAQGDCIAVLSEGPESPIPGSAKARKYPTRTVRDMVFVWMGEGKPVPIEADVPPEFFYPAADTMVFTTVRMWPIDWRVALENSLDAHVTYVHRNSLMLLREPFANFGPIGNRARTVNDSAAIGYMTHAPTFGQEFYPSLNANWPKTYLRRWWLPLFKLVRGSATKLWSEYPPFNNNEEWDMHTVIDGKRYRSGGHHLPSMFRFDFGSFMLTRVCVPIDAKTTRIVYYHAVHRKGWLRQAMQKLYFYGFYRWAMYGDFSKQDYEVMATQRYDLPEILSTTDSEVVAWRRLLLRARGMPQHEAPTRVSPTKEIA